LMQFWTPRTRDLKPTIYTSFSGGFTRGRRRNMKHMKLIWRLRGYEGRFNWSLSRLPFWLHRHHLLQQHDEEGVFHPLDYGDCGSNLYQTLSRAS
jgi:hypothetical protein